MSNPLCFQCQMVHRISRENQSVEEFEREIFRLQKLIEELEEKNQNQIVSLSNLQVSSSNCLFICSICICMCVYLFLKSSGLFLLSNSANILFSCFLALLCPGSAWEQWTKPSMDCQTASRKCSLHERARGQCGGTQNGASEVKYHSQYLPDCLHTMFQHQIFRAITRT